MPAACPVLPPSEEPPLATSCSHCGRPAPPASELWPMGGVTTQADPLAWVWSGEEGGQREAAGRGPGAGGRAGRSARSRWKWQRWGRRDAGSLRDAQRSTRPG